MAYAIINTFGEVQERFTNEEDALDALDQYQTTPDPYNKLESFELIEIPGKPMKYGEHFSEFNDVCPVHKAEIKKEYDFGLSDAHVVTFEGCYCAVSYPAEPEMHDNAYCYHATYAHATGRARLIVANNKATDLHF